MQCVELILVTQREIRGARIQAVHPNQRPCIVTELSWSMCRHPFSALPATSCRSPVADLPNSCGVIHAGGYDEFPVRTEGRAIYIPCVFTEFSQLRPAACFPHARGAVAAGGDDQLAIRAESASQTMSVCLRFTISLPVSCVADCAMHPGSR